MMTKKAYCTCIIDRFLSSHPGIDMKDLHNHITENASLAIAMEYLNLHYDFKGYDYAEERGGEVLAAYYDKDTDKVVTLTTRELIEMLPSDDVKEEEPPAADSIACFGGKEGYFHNKSIYRKGEKACNVYGEASEDRWP